jgi:hypothetical protein
MVLCGVPVNVTVTVAVVMATVAVTNTLGDNYVMVTVMLR